MRFLVLAGAGLLFPACAPPSPPSGEPPAWTIEAVPELLIASDQAPQGHEFAGIHSALRLPGGSFVLANTANNELLLFDSNGAFLRAVGRRGQGPGEFRGPIGVVRGPGGGFEVWDGGAMRWSRYDSAGGPIATSAPEEAGFASALLHAGGYVVGPGRDAVPAWVKDALETHRGLDPAYTSAIAGRVDDAGTVWLNLLDRPGRWSVYGPDGVLGQATFPERFTPLQAGEGFVLGIGRDALDVERLEVYRLTRSPAALGAGYSGARQAPRAGEPDTAMLRQLRRLIRNVMTAQEAQFAFNGSYTPSADSLRLPIEFPARVLMMHGDLRGYSALVVAPATGLTCATIVGGSPPPGWMDGALLCVR